MSDYMDYTFEEISVVLNGKPYLAEGTLCVEYDMIPPSYSTGDRGGPDILGFSDLRVTLTDEDGETLDILPGDMATLTVLMRQITPMLDQEYILEEISDREASW